MAADPIRPGTGVSRRILLQAACAALASLGVIITKSAAAQPKVSKQVVAYQDHPDGSKRCERCAQFEAPNGCRVVQGPIDPEGSCHLFMPIRQQASAPSQ